MLQYRIIVGRDICLTYYDIDELLKHYGQDVQVAIVTCSHPDRTVNALSNLKVSRFIEIIKYNNGNIYHMTLDEEPFYRSHPYYTKSILEKERLKRYYNGMSIPDDAFDNDHKHPITSYHSRFINTITVKNYLLSNDQTANRDITRLLYNLKLNMNLINQNEFMEDALNSASLNDFTLSMPVHQGAKDFFYSSGLYTEISEPSCVMIDGRCDRQLLLEHHLVDPPLATFDQLFNSDETQQTHPHKMRSPRSPHRKGRQSWEKMKLVILLPT